MLRIGCLLRSLLSEYTEKDSFFRQDGPRLNSTACGGNSTGQADGRRQRSEIRDQKSDSVPEGTPPRREGRGQMTETVSHQDKEAREVKHEYRNSKHETSSNEENSNVAIGAGNTENLEPLLIH
jgi:hypothetical protein